MNAQIRCVGTVKLRKVDQVPVERALEEAFRQGRLESNAAALERMMYASGGAWRRNNASLYDTLRRRNYFYDQTSTKNFLVFVKEIKVFFFLSIVDCFYPSMEHRGRDCDLCIGTIRKLDDVGELQPLARKERKYYEEFLYNYLFCSGRVKL